MSAIPPVSFFYPCRAVHIVSLVPTANFSELVLRTLIIFNTPIAIDLLLEQAQ
jgi:hypothetical protein